MINDNKDEIKTATIEEHQEALYTILNEFDRVCKLLNIQYYLFAGTMLGAVRHNGFIPWDDDLDILMMRDDYNRFLNEADKYIDNERFYVQKEFTEHWPMFFSKMRLNGTTCLEKYHPKDRKMHQGIYVDLFPCDNAAENSFLRKIQFYASKVVISKSLYQRGYETDSLIKKSFMQVCRGLSKRFFYNVSRLEKNNNSHYVHIFYGAGSKYEKSVFPRAWFQSSVEVQFQDKMYPVPQQYDLLLTKLYGEYKELPPENERKCKVHAILVDLHHSYEEYDNYRDNIVFTEFTRCIR